MPDPLPAAIGEVVAGRYRLDGLLGKGGMGAVYRATHTTLEQPVAIKLMLDGAMDPESRARFFREAKVIASLKNDHVVRVLDAGEHGDGLYIAMELLEGTDLGTLAQGPMDIPTAVGWVLQACTCLEEAHARGIIHRDLKPANLFL
ncbi:MAG: serine/threonine protein kinase, partial [Myxococcales bacterium]|nr:serine/threonine protein kinase [Myxococcales bacterium]